jgi:uncharacterized protein YjbI with pentapeptide repeats
VTTYIYKAFGDCVGTWYFFSIINYAKGHNAMTTATRDQEIKDIHEKYLDFYKISGGLSLIVIGIWIGSLFFGNGYGTNVYTEFLSVVATIAVIEQLNRRRDREAHKQDLIRQSGSVANSIAIDAIEQLNKLGLTKGENSILQGLDLSGANLANARLNGANLTGARLGEANLAGAQLGKANLARTQLGEANLAGTNLWRANLTGANLWYANLTGTRLGEANLAGAKSGRANLTGAELGKANLTGAQLVIANLARTQLGEANLTGTNLWRANLAGANLRSAEFNEETVLSDKTQWTPNTDMTRFTNPEHKNFWQPDYLKRDTGVLRPDWVTDDMLID